MHGPWKDKHPTDEDLKKILNAHRTWLFSRGRKGQRADLAGVRLTKALLMKADLRAADLTKAHLTKVHLVGAHLDRANLEKADLTGANLKRASLFGADLSGACLRAAGLRSAVLKEADLRGADLSGADLTGADLSGADLSGADLTIAVLAEADMSGADLTEAEFRGADLTGADLRKTRLDGADLSLTQRHDTKVANRHRLAGVKGLEDMEGFVFEEEDLSGDTLGDWEREPDDIFGRDSGAGPVGLPGRENFSEWSRIAIFLTIMDKGLQLILSTPHEDLQELMERIRNAEIFRRLGNGQAPDMVVRSGSVEAIMEDLDGVRERAGSPARALDPPPEKNTPTTEGLQKKQEVLKQGINSIMPIMQAMNLPEETKAKAAKVMEKYLNTLEGVVDKMTLN